MNAQLPEPARCDSLAALLKAAADPLRLHILRVLAQDSYGVSELARLFGVRQSGMSHHLKLLAQVGLVGTRREGNSIFYRRGLVGHDAYAQLRTSVFRQVDELLLGSEVEQRLSEIRAERVASSQAFFSDNSELFRSQQDLIASYPVYADHVLELLQQIALPSQRLAVEIGPGQGEFLSVLSPRFDQVVAVDINQAMLQQAAASVAAAELENVMLELVDGAGFSAASAGTEPALVVANMVLHHVPSPVALFQQSADALMPGGSFLVTDLCLHDQNWARTACGDLWLGFDPDDLSDWANVCGFSVGQSLYFALRNGFQIQIRQFIKN